MTRQLTFLLNNFVYREHGEPDTDDPGLMIPRYKASGRMSPDGKIYPEVTKKDETKLVPVRSIVTKRSGNLDEITPDLLSKRMKAASFPDGSAIGVSLGTSLTEKTTQDILGLKHGGHERVLDTTGNLIAPKNCKFREEGRFIYLKVRGGEYKYPRPSDLVTFGKESFKEGEIVCTAYHTTSPVYKSNGTIKLLKAKGSNGTKYFEKDNVIVADCYAYEDGIIKYKEGKTGNIEVYIGSRRYQYSPESLYYFPDGASVKKFDRICSGVVDMSRVSAELGGDISSIFQIFRKQYYSLQSSTFNDSLDHIDRTLAYVADGDMQEEIIELVFAGLIKVNRNEKSPDKIDNIDFEGTQQSVLNRDSFFVALSYGWSSRIINKAMKGDLNLKPDLMTQVVLGILLQDKLDKD